MRRWGPADIDDADRERDDRSTAVEKPKRGCTGVECKIGPLDDFARRGWERRSAGRPFAGLYSGGEAGGVGGSHDGGGGSIFTASSSDELPLR